MDEQCTFDGYINVHLYPIIKISQILIMSKLDAQKNYGIIFRSRITQTHENADIIKLPCIKYIVILLNILGLNTTLDNKDSKRPKWLFILGKCSYYTWKIILVVLLITSISYCIFSNSEGDIKIFLSFATQRILCVINSIIITKKNDQFIKILYHISHFRYIKKLNTNKLNWFIGSATLCTLVYMVLLMFIFFQSSSAYQTARIYNNLFGAKENSFPGVLLLHYFTSFIVLTVGNVFSAIFTMVNAIFSIILKKEFSLISEDTKRCNTKSTGEKVLKDYDKALEAGKLIDDTMCLPMSTVLSYIMLLMFYHGYRMCFSSNMGTMQVRNIIFLNKIVKVYVMYVKLY